MNEFNTDVMRLGDYKLMGNGKDLITISHRTKDNDHNCCTISTDKFKPVLDQLWKDNKGSM